MTTRRAPAPRPPRKSAPAAASAPSAPSAASAPRRAPPGKREAQSAIRREQVLAAAFALFCEHGYAATSTRRIAAAAGVTEGLVFHYFPTKDALLFELAAQRHTFAGRVLTLMQRAGELSARELLQAVAAGLAGVAPEEGAFIGFMLAEAQVNPSIRAQMTAATAVVLDGFVQALARGVETGELRPGAALAVAAHGFFGGFLFFFTQHRHLGPAAWQREAAAFSRDWAEQCWRGIAAPAALSEHSTNDHTAPRAAQRTSR